MANDWQRFRWNLDNYLDESSLSMPPFIFRTAESNELAIVLRVVSSALLMERAWTFKDASFRRDLEKRCEQAFESKPPSCMVVQHGARVIGASVLNLDETADAQLTTGPCILHEYRCRGLGSALLGASLQFLHEQGLKQASALALANSVADRYVYRKFGSLREPAIVAPEPRLAA